MFRGSRYLENWPSDITISINGVETAVYCSPGDYGARRGKLTPPAWPNGNTQYGMLKTFSVKENGSYMDGRLVHAGISLRDIAIESRPYISLKIEIKETMPSISGNQHFRGKIRGLSTGAL